MIKNGIDLDKFEEITDVTFDNDNPHLALVHKTQGGAANGWHQSILTKADQIDMKEDVIKALEQITVKLSFEEFLKKFFGLWYDDAELLTKLLGFETEWEYYEKLQEEEGNSVYSHESFLEERVEKFQIMKSAESPKDIPAEDYLNILSLQTAFEKGVKQFDITFEEDTPIESEGVTDAVVKSADNTEDLHDPSDKTEVIKNKEGPLDIQELLKSAEGQALIQKMAEDQAKVEVEKAEAKVAEVESAKEEELAKSAELLEKASGELEGFREEKATMRKEGFVGLVKSFTFVEEADQEGLVAELMKGSEAEAVDMKVIVAQLEKAQAAVALAKSEFVASEEGLESKDEVQEIDKAANLADELAKKYAGQKFLD